MYFLEKSDYSDRLLEVSEEEQTRRLEARIHDPGKIWKLSPMDIKSYSRWYDYSRARDDMFKATDTPWAPWHVVRSDDKKRARLNTIAHILSQVPYHDLPHEKPVLPRRQKPHGRLVVYHLALSIADASGCRIAGRRDCGHGSTRGGSVVDTNIHCDNAAQEAQARCWAS